MGERINCNKLLLWQALIRFKYCVKNNSGSVLSLNVKVAKLSNPKSIQIYIKVGIFFNFCNFVDN